MPTVQQKLYQTVASSLDANNIRQAIAACRKLNTQYPDFFPGWCIAAEIHHRLSKHEAGLIATQRALELEPENIDVLLQRVDFFLALERPGEARDILLALSHRKIDSARTHDQIGRLLASLELHEQAMGHYRKALAREGENAELWYNLATAQRFLGLMEQSEYSLDKSLSLAPLDFEALAMRSSLRKQTPGDNHVDDLLAALKHPELADGGEVNVNYALAKEYDDIGDYSLSFKHLKQGADSRRKKMRYSVQADLDIIAAIKNSFGAEIFARQLSGFDSAEPIFILGMPRTGTTLVERILGSHTDIHSAGELDTFGREVMRQIDSREDIKTLSRAALTEISAQLDFAGLGQAYINGTRPGTGSTLHFIDKLPFNFLYAGLIHLALPRAKIINLTRHPMASAYAIYKQLFRDAYPFSYDLQDLGQYYVAYHKLMEHWHRVMPGAIYSVSYEQIVADTELESRKLLAYCDLEWQDQCLRFYDNQQASTTASASQVRQPIYTSSLEKWRQYACQLKPLESILNAAGIPTT